MTALFIALGVYINGGGMEQFNRRIVRCLNELQSSVELESCVVALWDSRTDAPQSPLVRFIAGDHNKLKTVAAFAWRVWRMWPDVVLYGHILMAPLACLARLLSPRSRNVLIVHGRDVWVEPFRRRVPMWEKLAVRFLIDRVISVSRFTESKMESAYKLPRHMFRLLPNAVDLPLQRAAPDSDCALSAAEFRILTTARLDYGARHKGCDKVIRALPAILSEFPNAYYEIAGRGPLSCELAALAEDLGVGRHVRILGYLDDRELEEAYRRAHVFVLASVGEGFGIVLLEAWRHGLPVVTGNKDASAEVVTNSLNGLCVNPDFPAELAAAIGGLLREPKSAAQMGRAGYETILRHYTHSHFRQRFLEVLQES